jgi:LacI family transcriptional regulator, gluconate utilization system Gnt-I transcriptional repressor
MRRVKMTDVAKAAGVSAMTVSRALKHDGRIAPATRQHILRIVRDMGYVPDRLAGSFSSQRSGFVALLVPSLNNPHFADTAAGLQEVLQPAGRQLILGATNYSKATTERIVETMLERRPEAMVLTYDDHTPRTRAMLIAAAVPVVEIWEVPRRPIGHVVGFCNRTAARAMTAHLIAQGRRRIGYIGETGDKGTRGAQRRLGFVDAVAAAGLDAARQVALVPPPVSMMQGRQAMQDLLRRWPDTDAVMCVSDPCAFGALTACTQLRRAVPDDIAIAGFGDFEISRCAVPSISTVAVSGHAIGSATGTLLLSLLEGDGAVGDPAPRIVEIAAAPVARDSTRR